MELGRSGGGPKWGWALVRGALMVWTLGGEGGDGAGNKYGGPVDDVASCELFSILYQLSVSCKYDSRNNTYA